MIQLLIPVFMSSKINNQLFTYLCNYLIIPIQLGLNYFTNRSNSYGEGESVAEVFKCRRLVPIYLTFHVIEDNLFVSHFSYFLSILVKLQLLRSKSRQVACYWSLDTARIWIYSNQNLLQIHYCVSLFRVFIKCIHPHVPIVFQPNLRRCPEAWKIAVIYLGYKSTLLITHRVLCNLKGLTRKVSDSIFYFWKNYYVNMLLGTPWIELKIYLFSSRIYYITVINCSKIFAIFRLLNQSYPMHLPNNPSSFCI